MKRNHRCVCLVVAVGLALLLTCVMAGSAIAKPKIYRSVPTRVTFSATKAPDGTITAKALFTSPDPRCLSAKRLLQKKFHGIPAAAGGQLHFGGAFTAPNEFYPTEQISEPFGADGFGAPPNSGLFAPIPPAGKSPYVWQAVWPGDAQVAVTNFYNKTLPRHYQTTVAAASGVSVGAVARPSEGQGLPYFKVAFNQGGKHIILKCGILRKNETPQQIIF